MGFWKRMLRMEAKGDIRSSLELFREVYGGGRESHSGKTVNLGTTLEDDTAYACMRVISEGCSQVPWHLYQKVNGRRTVADAHPLDDLLYRSPNDWGQTSFEFRETLLFHLLVAGNAFVFVNRVGRERKIRELIILEPRLVSVKQKDDHSLEYTVTADDGSRRVFGRDAIWHLRGPSWNAWSGLDAVKLARNAIGLSASLEQGQSEFQRNSASPSASYAVKDKLSPERFEFLAKWIDRHMPGGDRFGKPVILDNEAEWTSLMMTAVDQQLLETRRHQVESICRRFRVMPLMVGHPADMAARPAVPCRTPPGPLTISERSPEKPCDDPSSWRRFALSYSRRMPMPGSEPGMTGTMSGRLDPQSGRVASKVRVAPIRSCGRAGWRW